MKRILTGSLLFVFLLTTVFPAPAALAQSLSSQVLKALPEPGSRVTLSSAYAPVMLQGLTVHKENPFLLDFIVDPGDDHLSEPQLKTEGEKLVRYFLASMTIPEKDLWVNLSPYEKNRVIPAALGQTDMGRDLLAQDYLLKQISASLIYPEQTIGKTFWDRVYSVVQTKYPSVQIPVNTFNKVWIMADDAEVFERNQTVFVVNSHLKVMLEEDYLASSKHMARTTGSGRHSQVNQAIRELVLPELEREVNTGKNFATLRQIFNSLILANWYKNNLKQAVLSQVYADKSAVRGIDMTDETVMQEIYQRYVLAYKKGVFNYIKEPNQTDAMPRKYFSGGVNGAMTVKTVTGSVMRQGGVPNKNYLQLSVLAAPSTDAALISWRSATAAFEKVAQQLKGLFSESGRPQTNDGTAKIVSPEQLEFVRTTEEVEELMGLLDRYIEGKRQPGDPMSVIQGVPTTYGIVLVGPRTSVEQGLIEFLAQQLGLKAIERNGNMFLVEKYYLLKNFVFTPVANKNFLLDKVKEATLLLANIRKQFNALAKALEDEVSQPIPENKGVKFDHFKVLANAFGIKGALNASTDVLKEAKRRMIDLDSTGVLGLQRTKIMALEAALERKVELPADYKERPGIEDELRKKLSAMRTMARSELIAANDLIKSWQATWTERGVEVNVLQVLSNIDTELERRAAKENREQSRFKDIPLATPDGRPNAPMVSGPASASVLQIEDKAKDNTEVKTPKEPAVSAQPVRVANYELFNFAHEQIGLLSLLKENSNNPGFAVARGMNRLEDYIYNVLGPRIKPNAIGVDLIARNQQALMKRLEVFRKIAAMGDFEKELTVRAVLEYAQTREAEPAERELSEFIDFLSTSELFGEGERVKFLEQLVGFSKELVGVPQTALVSAEQRRSIVEATTILLEQLGALLAATQEARVSVSTAKDSSRDRFREIAYGLYVKSLQSLMDGLKPQSASPAQLSPEGGIDLKSANVQVSKDGPGVQMRIDPAMIEQIRKNGVKGLTPQILNIKAIPSIWPLFGMEPPQPEERLAGA